MDVNSQTSINETIEYTSEAESVQNGTKKRRSIRFPIGPIIFMIALVAIFSAQTFAYFTDSSATQSNQIITGSIDVSFIEVSEDGNFSWSADPVQIMPASVYTYGGVGVENNGTIPVYIRIKVEKTIIQSEHEISPGWEHLIDCNFMTNEDNNWVYHEGYYYYKFALASEEQTTSLFEKVLFAPEMGNEFKNSSIQFKLICQSVQANGNSPDPTTAWGWPENSNLSE